MKAPRALLIGLGMALGACSVVNDPAQREADLQRLSALLKQKRAHEHTASPQSREFSYGACPEALLGASMEQIQARLGNTWCSKTQPTCVYAFYYHPTATTGGGGPELALTFDENSRVSDVECDSSR